MGQTDIVELLRPVNRLPSLSDSHLSNIQRRFHDVIYNFFHASDKPRIRYPNIEICRELDRKFYMPIPGMYGVSPLRLSQLYVYSCVL